MKNFNPYVVLVFLLFLVYLAGCQTTSQDITLDSCSLACYPGRVELVVVKHGVCKCAERGSYYGD